MKKVHKVGLVLGGGGARGLAHIGVLKVLEREKIPIDLIVGTSAGALFGAMYCQLGNTQAMADRFIEFVYSELYESSGLTRFIKKQETENFFGQIATRLKERIVINMAYSRDGLFNRRRLREVVDFLITEQRIEESPIPFAAVAVDLFGAKEVVLCRGSFRFAVEASSALPGYFTPVNHHGKLLVDGAVLQTVPVPVAKKMGAKFVIAVNVSQELDPKPELDNVINIIFHANSITNHRYSQSLLKEADIVLRPSIGTMHWSDFDNYAVAIAKGEEAANQALPMLRQKLADLENTVHASRLSKQKLVEIGNEI